MKKRLLFVVRTAIPIVILGALALAGEAGQRWLHP